MKRAAIKIYRAKLDSRRLSKVVGWPKPYHLISQKKSLWQTIRAMLF